jgi:phosphoglycolate phosphatase-like HAD superfamily hydrolase
VRVELPLRPGVLFDVDGTLVDSNYLHTLAWLRALRDAGEWAPMNAIHRLNGMGGDQLVPTLLGHECDEAASRRPGRYRELLLDLRPFPGAAGLLARCHASGIAVVLATSSPADELETALRVLGGAEPDPPLDEVIDARTNADDVAKSKPEPDVFTVAMERGGIDPARALTVGDSVWDVEAARAAGIGCVGVESGGFSRHELAEAGAVAVYRDVQALLDGFAQSPLAALAATAARPQA